MCCAATLVDTVGTAALVTFSDSPAVSVHIGIEYFSPVARGDTAVVEATVLQNGKRLANVEVLFPSSTVPTNELQRMYVVMALPVLELHGGSWG